MEFISVFDVFKIGVGPSSSHTLGPWRAAEKFISNAHKNNKLSDNANVSVRLFGSLSLTGKGHATDLAIVMGLAGYDPVTIDTKAIDSIILKIKSEKQILIRNVNISFDPINDIHFEKEFLPYHANGMIFILETPDGNVYSETYYSIGGIK